MSDLLESPGGSTIYRHEVRARDFEVAIGDEQNIEAISNHIEAYIGPVDAVFHELVSDLVHIDVHWVSPTETRPWHTLVTSGMSDRPMAVPDGMESFAHAELMMSLPSGWPISQEAFADERNYWPVRLLKMIARLPHEFDTWLGAGHTVPNGDPPEPYAPNTKFSCVLLLPPIACDDAFHELELDDDRRIRFYTIVPLYGEETDFKLEHGLDALLDRLEKVGVGEVVDVNRANACRRRRFGWS